MTDQQLDEGVRRLKLTPASQITPKQVRWAWQWDGAGRIPSGSLALAAGREGTGKSSFGMWIAAQITAGTLPGSYEGTPRSVLYVAFEDSWEYTLVPRLMAAGADLDRVYRVQAVAEFDEEVSLTLPHDLTRLQAAIEKKSAALVVFDPMMSTLGESLSASRSREVRKMLDPLVRMAQATDCIMLGIAHHNKGAHGDPIMSVSESKAWTDVPRSVFAFARDEENNCRVMSQTKNSLGPDPSNMASLQYDIEPVTLQLPGGATSVGRFQVLGTSEKTVADIARENLVGEPAEEASSARLFIFDYLTRNGGEAEAGEVLKAGRAAGFNEKTLKNVRAKMKAPRVDSRKASMGAGWVWAISTDGTTETQATETGAEERRSLEEPTKVPIPFTPGPSGPSGPSQGREKGTPTASQASPYCIHGGPIGMPCTQCKEGENKSSKQQTITPASDVW